MTYLFKCKAAGDVLMLGPDGDRILRLIGKEPGPTGIIEPAALPAAMQALEQAIRQDERHEAAPGPAASEADAAAEVGLRQRAWPLLELMKAAQGAHEVIVWGV